MALGGRRLADVFLHVKTKTDSREVRSEVDRGIKGARLGQLGDRHGQIFSKGMIDGLNKRLKSNDIKAFGSHWQAVLTAALAVGPAAVPTVAVLSSAILSVGAAAVSAGAALGVFGIAAGVAFKEVTDQSKKLSDLNDKIILLQERINIAPKGSALQKSLIKTQTRDINEFEARLDMLDPALRKAVSGFLSAKGAAKGFVDQNKPVIYERMAQAFNIFKLALPQLQPLFEAGARGAKFLLDVLESFVRRGGLKSLVDYLASHAEPALRDFEAIFENLIRGIGGVGKAFGASSPNILGFLRDMSERFREFGQNLQGSGGFSEFVKFLNQNGPDVVSALKDIAVAAFNIAKATAPLAPLTFAFVKALATITNSLPTPVLTALVAAFIALNVGMRIAGEAAPIITGGMKAINFAVGLAGKSALGTRIQLGLLAAQQKTAAGATIVYNAALSGIQTVQRLWEASLLRTRIQLVLLNIQTKIVAIGQKIAAAATAIWAGAMKLLNLAFVSSPIGLIILGITALIAIIVLVATKTQFFQTIWRVAWGAITKAAQATWNWIKSNWPLILGILMGPIGIAVGLIIKNWDAIKRATGNVIIFILLMLGKFFDSLGAVARFMAKLPGPMQGPFKAAANAADAAARKVRGMVASINDSINGLKNKTFTVTAKASVLMGQGLSRADAIATSLHRATGGAVFGAGTATSDSIPAMLSNGEHVWTAREVAAAGGHAAVEGMRKQVVAGYAGGGAVMPRPGNITVVAKIVGLEQFKSDMSAVNAFATKLARSGAERANAAGGTFSPNLAGVVQFANKMQGRPYIWGSAGPSGFDCSGFVSNLVEVAKGMPLYRRLFSTATMSGYPWTNHFGGAFRVGWTTNAGGGIGHTAATVNGVNMESRGGDGVVVGSRSRGANQGIFNRHAFLARGGPVLPGDPPFDILDRRGKHYMPGIEELLQGVASYNGMKTYDRGGFLPPRSVTIAKNMTNQYEPVGFAGMTKEEFRDVMMSLRLEVTGDTARFVAKQMGRAGSRGKGR